MNYVVVGLNHKSAPVDLRERLCFPPEGVEEALQGLLDAEGVEEGLILSTCNRVEVYAAGPEGEAAIRGIKRFLSDVRRIGLGEVEPHLYGYRDQAAVRHGFRVTASLDSMVVGETQITGQVKKAFEQAISSKCSGIFLHRFMHRAIQVAKRVRAETGISSRAASVGSAGVDLAKKIFGTLSQKRVALIGAGKIGELVLSSLRDEGVTDLAIYNRSHKELGEGAEGIRTLPLEQCWEGLVKADVVITSLGGNEAFLTREKLAALMERRRHSPLFLIDLGLPRNIEASANKLGNVYLYNIDDLNEVIRSNRKVREEEAVKAEEIVEKEASRFYESMLKREPTIARLGRKFEEIRRREVEKTLKKLSHLKEDDRRAVEKCAEAIVTRILHDPAFMLRSEDTEERDWDAAQLLKKLFRLEEP